MGRAPCCDKANVKRGPWSPDEDTTLKNYVERHGTGGNWISLPQKAGLKRCGKSCRLRWLNYLRPDIKHGGFTEEEDEIICSLFKTLGSRWSVIASHLQGRTDNDVKNHWNTKLKKKLMAATANSVKPQGPNDNARTSSSPMALNNPENFQYNWTRTPIASSTLLPPIETGNFDHGWDFDQKPFACSNPFTLPAPTEVSDMSSTLTNYSISSSSQGASGSTTPLTTDTNTFRWQGIGGTDFDSLIMDFGYGSPHGLGAYICPQEKLGEVPPCPSYLSYHSSSASNGSSCYGYQPSIMY